jgi:hypothetical protein
VLLVSIRSRSRQMSTTSSAGTGSIRSSYQLAPGRVWREIRYG